MEDRVIAFLVLLVVMWPNLMLPLLGILALAATGVL
jgi:nitrate reductase NapE component